MQRARREKEDVRKGVRDGDQDQAGHREDVEGEPIGIEHVAQEDVDQSRVRAEQVDVGDGEQEGRRQVGQGRRHLDEAPAGDIGPAHRPGHRQADENAEERRQRAEDQGVVERLEIEAARQRLAEIAGGDTGLAPDAAYEQRA